MNKTSSNWIYKQPDLNFYFPSQLFSVWKQILLFIGMVLVSILLLTHTVKLNVGFLTEVCQLHACF